MLIPLQSIKLYEDKAVVITFIRSYFETLNEINLPSLGHAATHGCSRCNKLFPGAVGNKNYGGFDNPDSWPKQTTIEHREQMSEILNCTTGQDREK